MTLPSFYELATGTYSYPYNLCAQVSHVTAHTPVTATADPPSKNIQTQTIKKRSIVGKMTLKDQSHKKKRTSTDAKTESTTIRSVAEGILAKLEPLTTSLNS